MSNHPCIYTQILVPRSFNQTSLGRCYMLATSEAELHELVVRLDRVSRKYSLFINVNKTKVKASNGIACRMLIQNQQLE